MRCHVFFLVRSYFRFLLATSRPSFCFIICMPVLKWKIQRDLLYSTKSRHNRIHQAIEKEKKDGFFTIYYINLSNAEMVILITINPHKNETNDRLPFDLTDRYGEFNVKKFHFHKSIAFEIWSYDPCGMCTMYTLGLRRRRRRRRRSKVKQINMT